MFYRLICATGLMLALSSNAWAENIADTPANRMLQAERYLQSTPPKAMLDDMARKMAGTMPVERRQVFIQLMTEKLDVDALTQAMKSSIVKTFTAEEIQSMANFYGSPVGRSVTAKMGNYMADIMPMMQKEILKAVQKAQSGK